jgi:hypothetical protein
VRPLRTPDPQSAPLAARDGRGRGSFCSPSYVTLWPPAFTAYQLPPNWLTPT